MCHDIQQNDTQQNEFIILFNCLIGCGSSTYAECQYAECHCAECHYSKCHCAECHHAECFGALNVTV